jgi:hypothetical protein
MIPIAFTAGAKGQQLRREYAVAAGDAGETFVRTTRTGTRTGSLTSVLS